MWAGLTLAVRRWRGDLCGATAIEYALLAAMVAGAAMAGLIALGASLDLLFTNVADQVAPIISNMPPPPDPERCVEVQSACPK